MLDSSIFHSLYYDYLKNLFVWLLQKSSKQALLDIVYRRLLTYLCNHNQRCTWLWRWNKKIGTHFDFFASLHAIFFSSLRFNSRKIIRGRTICLSLVIICFDEKLTDCKKKKNLMIINKGKKSVVESAEFQSKIAYNVIFRINFNKTWHFFSLKIS